MSKKKPVEKKTEKKVKVEKKVVVPKIAATRKDAIIGSVHEKVKAFKAAPALAVKEGVKNVKHWLEQQPEVESVVLIGDSDMTVKFKDGTQVGVMMNRKNLFGGGGGSGASKVAPSAVHMRTLSTKLDPHPISNKACVIDTLYDDWPGTATPDTIVSTLKNAGYEVDLIKNNNANLKFYSNLDEKEYGIVFIMAHGGMMNVSGDNKLHIMARPFFTSFPPSSGYTGVGVFTVDTNCTAQGWAYVYAFNNLFVSQYMNKRYFPNSLIHLLVCEGANPDAQNDMIQTFLDRGVGCYTGWTKDASGTHGSPAAVQFFQVLCDSVANPTNTVTNAISKITASGHSPDPGTGASLVAYGLSNMQIIHCSIVKEVSHIVIQDSSGKTIKKGFHDILDAMEYSENQINAGKHASLKITETVGLKKIQW